MATNDASGAGGSTEIECGHGPCACTADDSGYCSVQCAEENDADEDMDACACGHADCATAAVQQQS
jgi:hypothetical protein